MNLNMLYNAFAVVCLPRDKGGYMKRFLTILITLVFTLLTGLVPLGAQSDKTDEIQLQNPEYVARFFILGTFYFDLFEEVVKPTLILEGLKKSVEDSVNVIKRNDKIALLSKMPKSIITMDILSTKVSENQELHMVAVVLCYEEDVKYFYVYPLKYLKEGICFVSAVHELKPLEVGDLLTVIWDMRQK